MRKISKTPFKVLEAPNIEDDYYLNLVDWSSSNLLAVGLKNCVYLWNASTSQVSKLCESESEEDKITSVSWIQRVCYLVLVIGIYRYNTGNSLSGGDYTRCCSDMGCGASEACTRDGWPQTACWLTSLECSYSIFR